jgi:hypothetical protein
MDPLFTQVMKEAPALAVMGIFAWALLSIVKQVLSHYQTTLSDILARILQKLDAIDERTRKCRDSKPDDD